MRESASEDGNLVVQAHEFIAEGESDGLAHDKQQMTANDFEISNRSSVRGLHEPEDDISRMINESYLEQNNT